MCRQQRHCQCRWHLHHDAVPPEALNGEDEGYQCDCHQQCGQDDWALLVVVAQCAAAQDLPRALLEDVQRVHHEHDAHSRDDGARDLPTVKQGSVSD